MLLPRAGSGDLGLSPSRVQEFFDGAGALGIHSLMVLRRGKVTVEAWWEPYSPDRRHMLFSLSKSFMSTAVGFAVQEGLLSLDEPVGAVFEKEGVQDRILTLRHLLSMSAGHGEEPWAQDSWIQAFFEAPRPHPPGVHFLYSTPSSCVAGAAVERRAGMDLIAFLTPRLFEPLGIDGTHWQRLKDGTVAGGYGLSLRTEEIAAFGLFLSQGGQWQGRQLLDPSYFAQATSKQVENGSDPESDWNQGYGYQFWRTRHGSYRGDGAFGQFCLVLPCQEAVVVMTSGSDDLQGILNLVWRTLLPGLEEGGEGLIRGEGLEMDPPGPLHSDQKVEGGTWSLEANPAGWLTASLAPSGNSVALRLEGPERTDATSAGLGFWQENPVETGPSLLGRFPWSGVALSRADVLADGTLQIRRGLVETPLAPCYKIKIEGSRFSLQVTRDHSLACPFEVQGTTA